MKSVDEIREERNRLREEYLLEEERAKLEEMKARSAQVKHEKTFLGRLTKGFTDISVGFAQSIFGRKK